MNQLIAIVGPTGIGKSRLALQIALRFCGEIVGADSRQIYRHMDIGTAKSSREDMAQAPHQLIDIINPDADFSLAQYQQMAYSVIAGIHRRRKLPLLVGGSGLYVRAVLEGWQVPEAAPDLEFRKQLEEKAAAAGPEALQQERVKIDPAAAETIDPRNIRRIIRALEVHRRTGSLFSKLQIKNPPPYNTLTIGLTAGRKELYRRTDDRVDRMLQQGLIEEVKKLLDMGYSLDLPSMSGIGYRHIGLYLKGKITLAEAAQQIKFETHRFIRHQYNWFRLKDPNIKWFDVTTYPEDEIMELVSHFLNST